MRDAVAGRRRRRSTPVVGVRDAAADLGGARGRAASGTRYAQLRRDDAGRCCTPLRRGVGSRARARRCARCGSCASRFCDALERDATRRRRRRRRTAATPERATTTRPTRPTTFEDGLIDGLREQQRAASSASRRPTPTRRRSRGTRTHGLSSVDDVDEPGGPVALVFALAGASGASASSRPPTRPLPEAPARPTRRAPAAIRPVRARVAFEPVHCAPAGRSRSSSPRRSRRPRCGRSRAQGAHARELPRRAAAVPRRASRSWSPAVLALVPLALLAGARRRRRAATRAAAGRASTSLGVALLGLVDDLLGRRALPRGWRGHGARPLGCAAGSRPAR